MLIGIDKENNIKQINTISDTNLKQIDINRDEVFTNFSDTRILNYKYIEFEGSYSIVPATSLQEIELLEKQDMIDKLMVDNLNMQTQIDSLITSNLGGI